MNAGDLNKRICLLAPATQRNGTGEELATFTEYAKVWAAVNPLNGRELERGKQIAATVSHEVRIRYRTGVNPKQRIVLGTRTLEINAVINKEERNVELLLYCSEVV